MQRVPRSLIIQVPLQLFEVIRVLAAHVIVMEVANEFGVQIGDFLLRPFCRNAKDLPWSVAATSAEAPLAEEGEVIDVPGKKCSLAKVQVQDFKGPGASKKKIRKISVFQWTDLWYSHYSNFKALHHDILQFCLNTFHSKRLHCQLEAPASFEIQWWCHRTTQRPEDQWRSRCGRAKVVKFQGWQQVATTTWEQIKSKHIIKTV